MINNHTQLLNYLVAKHNLKSYLEVGVQNKANNFNKINNRVTGGPLKTCVDPDPNAKADFICTSDDFFKSIIIDISSECGPRPSVSFDLIFIDGYHEAQQVKRDFENSLRCLNDGGYIVIHDTLPENEAGTKVPRETKVWWGDVYKFAMNLGNCYQGINYVTVNMDNGCTVVWKIREVETDSYFEYSWEDYQESRNTLLQIIPPSDIEKYL